MLRVRRIAILIDGGFFLKKLPKLVDTHHRDSAATVAKTIQFMCKRHVQRLSGEAFSEKQSRWRDHLQRIFYYDARPYEGKAHHPIDNKAIDYSTTKEAQFRKDLFSELRNSRQVSLRLGQVVKGDWQIQTRETKKLLKLLPLLKKSTVQEGWDSSDFSEEEIRDFEKGLAAWQGLTASHVTLGLRQKGVDMRLGIDVATLSLKQQIDTLILVTGDSDFIPAAKVARREGVEVILDPLWHDVNDELKEHIDGIQAGLPAKKSGEKIDLSIDEA